MIRQLLRIISEIDRPSRELVSKFFELERADAEDVQKKLEDIVTKQNQQQAGGGVNVTNRVNTPAPRVATTPEGQPLPPGAATTADTSTTIEINAGGPNEENIVVGKIKITADKRTNRIHIMTREENMPFIEQLIHEFDANVAFGIPTARPLRYVSAADVLKVAVKAISDPGAKEATGDTAASGGGAPRPGGAGRGQGTGGSLFGGSNYNNDTGGGMGGGGGGGLNTSSEELELEELDTKPEAVTVGNTRIIADKRSNTIIVIGSEDVKEKLFKVIDELDKRAAQVMFHVVIGELSLSDKEQFGVDYIIRNAGLGLRPSCSIRARLRPPATTPTGDDDHHRRHNTSGVTANNLVSINGNQPC